MTETMIPPTFDLGVRGGTSGGMSHLPDRLEDD